MDDKPPILKVTGGRKVQQREEAHAPANVKMAQAYAQLNHMGNPAQELALRGGDYAEALKVPKKPPVPGGRGNLTEMSANQFLRQGFPSMPRKERRKLIAVMKRRKKAGLDPFTGEPVPDE